MRILPGVAVAVVLAACGGGPSKPAVHSVTTPPSASNSAPATFGGSPGQAQSAACLADAQAVQQAADAYELQNGHPAASIGALVAAGHLRAAPSTDHGYAIAYDAATGKVSATGACRFPA